MAWKSAFTAALLTLLLALFGGIPASGQDFRVDTELFLNQEKEPFLQQLTIFHIDGTIYDFCLTEPQEASVFNPRHGRFTLLDPTRKVKATITTQELLDFSLALETHAAQARDPLFSFCAVPKFETTESAVEQAGQMLTEVKLSARPLIYVARGQKPQHAEAVKIYRHFADWYARLNATRPGGLPAGARLALNQALADRELLPLEVVRTTLPLGPFGKKLEVKSQHRLNWSLSGEDHKKIDRAGDMLATFADVSYDDFRGIKSQPSKAKQARR